LTFFSKTKKNIGLMELKYKTKSAEVVINGERFKLKNQSAQDTGRYDFLKDVSRLEDCVDKLPNAIGYAIFLTNDPLYWNFPRKTDTEDKDFRLYEGRIVKEH